MKYVISFLILISCFLTACSGVNKSKDTGALDPNPAPLEDQIAEAMLMNDHNEGANYTADRAGLRDTDEDESLVEESL